MLRRSCYIKFLKVLRDLECFLKFDQNTDVTQKVPRLKKHDPIQFLVHNLIDLIYQPHFITWLLCPPVLHLFFFNIFNELFGISDRQYPMGQSLRYVINYDAFLPFPIWIVRNLFWRTSDQNETYFWVKDHAEVILG